MTLADLQDLLKRTIGLDPATVGLGTVERAIRERIKANNSATIEAYWNVVSTSITELQELIEAVVVLETWFFRDPKAFSALEKLVREEWLPRNPSGSLRLLSVPCASGEEPYSLAIALQTLGLERTRVRIDAVDVSQIALTRARTGVFGRNSFRGEQTEFRSQFFSRADSGYVLCDAIRSAVQFEQGNIFDDNYWSEREKYHFIFCRNLLIYFDAATQKRVIQTLNRLLADDGVLFVGPSESCVMLNHGFVSAQIPFAFAFRRLAATPVPVRETKRRVIPTGPPPILPAPVPTKPVEPAPVQQSTDNLEFARRLADEGKLEKAAEICRAHIQDHGPSAQAFYLLGLVQDAGNGREQAREFYRKAIYLQPDHYEALVHLALLTRSLGDQATARLLQERAERVKQGAKS